MSTTVEGRQLKAAVKQLIKQQGFNYSDLAEALKVSLPTVRRYMSKDDLSVDTLVAICDWLAISFFDLVKMAEQHRHLPTFLTEEQEAFFASFPHFYTYLRLLGGGLTPEDIAAKHSLSASSTEVYITELERLGLISRVDTERVKLRIAWPAHWNFPGPLQAKYTPQIYRTAVEHLTARTVEDRSGYGTEFFFMMDSLLLREPTYREYVREMVTLYERYNTIGRHESKVTKRENLRLCAAIVGIDRFDPLTDAMGPVKDVKSSHRR